jgi:hypothetical protein
LARPGSSWPVRGYWFTNFFDRAVGDPSIISYLYSSSYAVIFVSSVLSQSLVLEHSRERKRPIEHGRSAWMGVEEVRERVGDGGCSSPDEHGLESAA